MHADKRAEIKEVAGRRHRRLRRPEGHRHRRHAGLGRRSGGAGAHGLPGAGDRHLGRAAHQGSRREDDASACRSWPARTRRCGCAPTRRPARPSCPAWASCTWRSSSTGCAANTASTPISARRRWRIAKRSPRPHTETYTHKKQSGGSGQYAEVKIIFEPLERNAGVVFENKVVGGSVPKEYIPAVEKGIRVQADTGVLAGFPTVDFKYTLMDGKYHDVDSSRAGVRNRRQGLLPRGHEEGRRRSSWSRSWTWR